MLYCAGYPESGPHVPSVRAAHTVVSNLRPLSYAPFLCGRYFAFSTATYDAVMTFLYAIDAMLKKEPDRAPSTLRGRDLYAPLSPGHIWPGTAPHLPQDPATSVGGPSHICAETQPHSVPGRAAVTRR